MSGEPRRHRTRSAPPSAFPGGPDGTGRGGRGGETSPAGDSRHPTLPGRVALVQDALPCRGGAERVLETVVEVLPRAPIHTLTYNPAAFRGTPLEGHEVHTSFLDRLPGMRSGHRRFLPLFPWAIETLDLREYDFLVSFSYAVAHGIVPRPDQLHVCYTYAPLRHAWQQYHDLVGARGIRGRLVSLLLHYVRLWDAVSAARVDRFVAISGWVADCIRRAYRRRAQVIYPPVAVEQFEPLAPRRDYYLVVSRLAPHKRVDLILEAFRRLGSPLLVVGDGSERRRLVRDAPPNVEFLGTRPDGEVAELMGRARGFVHAAEEDFGIALVEAQAAGCPVIAYGRGGAAETVVHGRTGLLFGEQTPEAVVAAVRAVEEGDVRFPVGDLRRHAERFSRDRFRREFTAMLEREWARFRRRGGRGGGGARSAPDRGGSWKSKFPSSALSPTTSNGGPPPPAGSTRR